MKNEIEILQVHREDLEAIASIESQCFTRSWSLQSFEEALAREENIFLCAKISGVLVGYVLLYMMLEEGEIPTIAVAKNYRRRGVANLLIKEAMLKSKERGALSIFLEVRVSNLAAIALYQKNGFEIVGNRKRFYVNPVEDAYLCKAVIGD